MIAHIQPCVSGAGRARARRREGAGGDRNSSPRGKLDTSYVLRRRRGRLTDGQRRVQQVAGCVTRHTIGPEDDRCCTAARQLHRRLRCTDADHLGAPSGGWRGNDSIPPIARSSATRVVSARTESDALVAANGFRARELQIGHQLICLASEAIGIDDGREARNSHYQKNGQHCQGDHELDHRVSTIVANATDTATPRRPIDWQHGQRPPF